ncbi:LysR family transcriptional regulator [Clostridium grantii]|uniref:DNA-binding transcriptional regulator, LysR family n=1 Tax=Clostridium grantii DSM 8605 TaxID=1121316 RepID=A0A1M5XN57_9CLOT|nr:LysR family transcriptional regulator [Clostridium grantii]SHI01092.1 DNA-binding transcriptional regulator, LysR family [Clostridium grantii DSM 8605]
MQMRFIESFLTLYDELNISKASLKLFITQQGLSRQINTLEKELDVVLFKRTKTGVEPTVLCNKLYPHLKEMHTNYTQVLQVLEYNKQKERKLISIAFAYGISHGIHTDFIFHYQKDNPDTKIEIQEWSKKVCIEKLMKNEIDIAFLVNPFDIKALNSHVLVEGYMYCALHKDHPLATADPPINFSLLDGETIITGPEENVLRELFDYYCTLTNIHPNILFSSSYSLDIINSMTKNKGIATVTSAMAAYISNPDIKILRLLTPQPGYIYCCTSKDEKNSKSLCKIVKYIKNYFKSTPVLKID